MPYGLTLTILLMVPKAHYKDKLYQSYSLLDPISEKAHFKKPEFSKLNMIIILLLQKIQHRKIKKPINTVLVFLKIWKKVIYTVPNTMEQNQSRPQCYFILNK